ncbi:MAG: 4-hydroxy-tetrahydrodipicolinate synthase [Chlamydiales bacterium]|nr:4-hydroxy-tetrahydrodipicolinate synthase [Chlamydiales bacterium]
MRGAFVAVPTPFTEAREFDQEAFQELIEWQIQEGTDGLIVCGTAGEAPTLSEAEQRKIIELAVQISNGRVKIIAGTGSNDTRKSLSLTEQAKGCGADGCMVIVPYYNRPSFAGCVAHYKEVAKAELPIILYHHPVRTGLRLTGAQIAELCQIEQIVAVKEASCDLDLMQELLQLTKKSIFTGDDSFTLATLAAGGAGVISTVGNLIPREWKKLITLMSEGNVLAARELFLRYLPLCKVLFLEANPSGVKYALSLMGKCLPHLRLPLVELQESTKLRVSEVLSKAVLLSNLRGCLKP